MPHCCGNHGKHTNKNREDGILEQPPKSFIGKYLYNLGKKDLEKERQSKKHKNGCC